MSTRSLTRAAVYAALYVALTLAPGLNAIAYGQVQFRVSECLLVFVLFDRAALPGLVVGTAIANGFGPIPAVDVWFGSLLTLVACLGMWVVAGRPADAHAAAVGSAGEARDTGRFIRCVIALAVPVVVNGLGVAFELRWQLELPFWPSVLWVSIGEATVLCILGLPLLTLTWTGAFEPVIRSGGRRRVSAGGRGGV